ncbi:transglycosylase family protein [Kitasatospora sp. NPDC088391]|uniref:transglycosylase family protein n=1 Tax=Kitasatospora sp. NPDC088391 TaxID=3364074 RepID=UPI00380F6FAD
MSAPRRKPAAVLALASAAALALPVLAAGTAQAASVANWDRVAQCESGGNWSINTGNTYYGGLQFNLSTWRAYGGTQYAAYPHQATKQQQILIGEKVLNGPQGAGAWPSCGGPLVGDHTNPYPSTPAPTERGTLYHEVRDPWGAWSGFAPVIGYGSAPSFKAGQEAVTSTPDKSTQSIALGNDGNLYHTARYPDGSWTGWAPLAGVGGAANFAASTFSIAGMPNGDAQVLAVGNDGGIYFTTRLVSGSWQGWSKVGDWTARKVSIAALPNGDAQVLIVGNDGLVYHNIHFAGGSWQGWNGVAGFGGAASFGASNVAITGMPNGDAQLVAVGNDGNVYHSVRQANGSWQGWGPVAGVGGAANFAASSIGITSTPNGDAQLVAVGNDGIAYHNARFYGGSWQGWGSLGFGAVNVAITGLADGSSQVLATHS